MIGHTSIAFFQTHELPMESTSSAPTKQTRWLALFFAVVAIFLLADWVQGGFMPTHRLLTGLGFLFFVPHAFMNSWTNDSPLGALLRGQLRPIPAHLPQLLDVLGLVLVIIGLASRWI